MSVVSIVPSTDLNAYLPGAQFSDAYSTISSNPELTARSAMESMFARQPRWIDMLMKLRDAAVAPLGLKTAKDAEQASNRIAIFPVLAETPTRLVAGLDDRHQDFRVIVEIFAMDAQRRVVLTTVVKTHNVLGRTYLAMILPFHRLIVRAMLRQIA